MAGLNPSMEDIHPDGDAVSRMEAEGYPPLKPVIDPYAHYLDREMRLACLRGLDQAATVTACAQSNSTMKVGLYLLHFVKNRFKFDRAVWDTINIFAIAREADLVESHGLDAPEERKHLDRVREHIHDDNIHCATSSWLKDYSPEHFVASALATSALPNGTGMIGDHLPVRRITRVRMTRNVCTQLIPLRDSLIRPMSKSTVAKVEDFKTAPPSMHELDNITCVVDEMHRNGIDADRMLLHDPPTLSTTLLGKHADTAQSGGEA